MAIKSYQKGPVSTYDYKTKDYIELEDSSRAPKSEKVTVWSGTRDGYDALKDLVHASKIANLVIPTFFMLLGFFFIGKYYWPEVKTWAENQSGITNQGTSSPVSDQFVDISKYISNPAGLQKVSEEAFGQNVLQKDPKSNNYTGIFYISIPSIGVNRLPVQSNTDSTTESAYNAVLKNSLAHFKNTGLPFSEIKNNIVIYGHSATPNYNPQVTDPEVAFSFLSSLRVGDEIILEMEGNTYTYKMYRSKIVEPNDLSIITGSKNTETLTLFTCYPAGNNAKRYVAVARPV